LQLVPGDGETGATLTGHPDVGGVMFTGSTSVARAIQRSLAPHLRPDGHPIPLIAETGGQNAMIVDSSALAEQVVADAVVSAFNSAGQRCSALRLLCLQDDVADRTLRMLRGAMAELRVGPPDRLSTDVGPVITEAARDTITAHLSRMGEAGHAIHSLALPEECAQGYFIPPSLIEIARVSDLQAEVFGPVLHVLRYRRETLDALLDDLAATGYALTFGVHTRLDETIAHVVDRAEAGNIYVNRNIVGAVVGVQPFGGHGLSGTGPKAGGPLILRRLLSQAPFETVLPRGTPARAALSFADHLAADGDMGLASRVRALAARSPLGAELLLTGPVGERNSYSLMPRGAVLCKAATGNGLALQLAAVFATGNIAIVEDAEHFRAFLNAMPSELQSLWQAADTDRARGSLALFEGDGDGLCRFSVRVAQQEGPVIPILALSSHEIWTGTDYPLEFMLRERSISVNTAAAGGNASLMSIG
jgi:RHH-type proline utilization regulon transcriptional repressor/proline dehydrogenase/delta 1-pyrroline-5-carboxylate dehydrogenase